MAATNTDKVQEAYIAYYGRPADPGGLTHWVSELDKGVSFDVMLQAFGTSDEAVTLFGNKTPEETIQTLFLQILGRTPDPSGLDFYVGKLKDGSMTGITIAQNVFDGATGGDAVMVANKLGVAKVFNEALDTAEKKTAYAGASAVVTLRDMVAKVDEKTDLASFDIATTISMLVTTSKVNIAIGLVTDSYVNESNRTDAENAAADLLFEAAMQAAIAVGATMEEIRSDYNSVLIADKKALASALDSAYTGRESYISKGRLDVDGLAAVDLAITKADAAIDQKELINGENTFGTNTVAMLSNLITSDAPIIIDFDFDSDLIYFGDAYTVNTGEFTTGDNELLEVFMFDNASGDAVITFETAVFGSALTLASESFVVTIIGVLSDDLTMSDGMIYSNYLSSGGD